MSYHKIRAIVDAFDDGNYKDALKLANKAIQNVEEQQRKKTQPAKGQKKPPKGKSNNNNNAPAAAPVEKSYPPEYLAVMSLKALTLDKLGRRSEVQDLVNFVVAANPVDPMVMRYLIPNLKLLKMHDELYRLTLQMYQKYPQIENLLELFSCHLRMLNYDKMNQVALNLFKGTKQPRYKLWSVVSLYLKNDIKSMELGQLMIQQLLENPAPHVVSEETVRLYIDLMYEMHTQLKGEQTEQTKADTLKKTILTILDNEVGTKNFQVVEDRIATKALMFERFGQVEDAHKVWEELLDQHDLDNWSYCLNYIKTGVQHFGSSFYEKATQFFTALQKKCENTSKRAPFLAVLHIELETGSKSQASQNLVGLVLKYFERFISKPCCFKDLAPYLEQISKSELKTDFLAAFSKAHEPETPKKETHTNSNNEESMDTSITTNRVLAACTYFKVNYFFYFKQEQPTPENRSEFVQRVYKLYSFYLSKLSAAQAPDLDVLVLLIANALSPILKNEQEIGDLVLFLEDALAHSPNSYQIKLFAIRLFNKLGAVKPALTLWDSLEVKSILRDSLSFLIFRNFYDGGFLQEGFEFCEKIKGLHDTNTMHLSDDIFRAFREGGYSKIKEFIDFQKRLAASQQLASARSEMNYLSLFLNSHTAAALEKYFIGFPTANFPISKEEIEEKYQINQDFTILEQYDENFSPSAQLPALKDKAVFELLRTNLLLHLFSALFKGENKTASDVLQALEKVVSALVPEDQIAVWGLIRVAVHLIINFADVVAKQEASSFDFKGQAEQLVQGLEKEINAITLAKANNGQTVQRASTLIYYVLNAVDLAFIVLASKYKAPTGKAKEPEPLAEARAPLRDAVTRINALRLPLQKFMSEAALWKSQFEMGSTVLPDVQIQSSQLAKFRTALDTSYNSTWNQLLNVLKARSDIIRGFKF